MDRITPAPQTQDVGVDPDVFFKTVDEMMAHRKQLTKDDLDKMASSQNANLDGNAIANAHVSRMLLEHFDDITGMAQRPTGLDSTFGEYYNDLFSESKGRPLDPMAADPGNAITLADIQAMKNVFNHNDEGKNLFGATTGRIAKRLLQSVVADGLLVGLSACATFDPEPLTKLTCFAGAVESAGPARNYARKLFEPAGTLLKKEYTDRQSKIDSWNYFDRKAMY